MFEEAQRSQPPGREQLGALLGGSLAAVDAALLSLARAGLVDARRVRLTMAGLVVAASTRSRRTTASRASRRCAPPPAALAA
jgi:Mn-dependent DtxR family transcriptional regulator